MSQKTIRVAVAGLGAIGMCVAQAVDRGDVDGAILTAVSANDRDKAAARVSNFATPPQVLPLDGLTRDADVVVECAPSQVFLDVAEPVIAKGLTLLPLSVGAILRHPELVARAQETGATILVPTGAIIGLDTVRAMAVGTIHSVTLVTRKPPKGLMGAPHLVKNGIDITDLTEPLRVFQGSAFDAAQGFPANVNVAAALALAGSGPEHTRVEVWADPTIDRNIQSVTIASDSGEATMTMHNIPSTENPRTGRIVANSVIASLRRLTAPLVVGS